MRPTEIHADSYDPETRTVVFDLMSNAQMAVWVLLGLAFTAAVAMFAHLRPGDVGVPLALAVFLPLCWAMSVLAMLLVIRYVKGSE